MEAAPRLLFCPNVLTETSNLIRHAPEPIDREIAGTLSALATSSDETWISSPHAMQHSEYRRLGLTDAVLLTLAAKGGALLTLDLDLYLAAARAGHEVINFNHLRAERPGFR